MAWIRTRAGIHYVYWRDGGRSTPVRCVRVGPKKSDALKIKAEIEHRRLTGRFGITVPDAIPFQDFADRWLATRTTASTTDQREREALRVHLLPALGPIPLYAITPQQVGALIAGIAGQMNPQTGRRMVHSARRTYAVLRKMLEDALSWGLVHENAAARIPKPPIPHHELQLPSVDELTQIIDAFRPPLRALIFVDLMSGLRWGELAALEWSDVNLEAGTLSVRRNRPSHGTELAAPKWGSARVVDMLWPARETLLDLPQRGRLVFPAARGGYLHYRNVQHRWQTTVRGLGLQLRFHDLRHAFASLQLAFGEHVLWVARQLGHSSPALTWSTYGHLVESGHRLDRRMTLRKLAVAYFGATRVLPNDEGEELARSGNPHLERVWWSRREDSNPQPPHYK